MPSVTPKQSPAPAHALPELFLRAWLRCLVGLPSSARRAWPAASSRRLDIGMHPAQERYATTLTPPTLAALAKLHIELAFTLYPPD